MATMGDFGTPKILLVETSEEQEQVARALVLLSRYPGVLDNGDGRGWLVFTRQAGTHVLPYDRPEGS